eukprot:7388423-Prymnesium_polylepis.1
MARVSAVRVSAARLAAWVAAVRVAAARASARAAVGPRAAATGVSETGAAAARTSLDADVAMDEGGGGGGGGEGAAAAGPSLRRGETATTVTARGRLSTGGKHGGGARTAHPLRPAPLLPQHPAATPHTSLRRCPTAATRCPTA